ALTGPFLVFVLAACGAIELVVRSRSIRLQKNGNQKDPDQKNRDQKNASRVKRTNSGPVAALLPVAIAAPTAVGGLLAVAWVAFKVGALSYGGGFVIIPLMQHDVVHTYHWMTGSQFLSAVALGQVTPGPVVQTVSVVGYAAAGLGGGLLASS